VVTKGFAEKAGVAMDYVQTRKWDNATVGKVLAWMEDNQGTNEDGARHFLETYPEMWTTWVAPDVAEKIKAAL
ncbi:MAG: glycine betaine ABC transporter substrate-binding protein, partial [Allorhizobium sp.]